MGDIMRYHHAEWGRALISFVVSKDGRSLFDIFVGFTIGILKCGRIRVGGNSRLNQSYSAKHCRILVRALRDHQINGIAGRNLASARLSYHLMIMNTHHVRNGFRLCKYLFENGYNWF